MNKWECGADGCDITAVGVGGAIGLRAIGWEFPPGGSFDPGALCCPAHRRRPGPCRDLYADEAPGSDCPACGGEAEADIWQALITGGVHQLAPLFDEHGAAMVTDEGRKKWRP